MSRGPRRSPALVIACLALFAALGGTVYAAKKIDGRAIRVKSLPGNRVKPRSLPGNRLRPGSVPGDRLKPGAIPGNRLAPGSITGNQIDAATLGQVPSAVHADNADSARDAGTALHAVSAVDAQKVNGYSAGCGEETVYFAGACWQLRHSEAAVTAPAAADSCATQGGELPCALALAAFSQQPGALLDDQGEWAADIPSISGEDLYAVTTVSAAAEIDYELSTETRKYRCVLPLLR